MSGGSSDFVGLRLAVRPGGAATTCVSTTHFREGQITTSLRISHPGRKLRHLAVARNSKVCAHYGTSEPDSTECFDSGLPQMRYIGKESSDRAVYI